MEEVRYARENKSRGLATDDLAARFIDCRVQSGVTNVGVDTGLSLGLPREPPPSYGIGSSNHAPEWERSRLCQGRIRDDRSIRSGMMQVWGQQVGVEGCCLGD